MLISLRQMLQPRYTMNGFNWFDKRGTEGIGFVRTLRTLLTNNLPQLLPDLTAISRTRLRSCGRSTNLLMVCCYRRSIPWWQ